MKGFTLIELLWLLCLHDLVFEVFVIFYIIFSHFAVVLLKSINENFSANSIIEIEC